LRANRKGTLHIQQQVQQPAVNNAHAFRFTGTAGGKQQVGLHIRQQRARCRIPDRIRHVLHQFRQRQLYNFTPLSRLTDHQTDQTRALHKALQTRGRLMNIERHVARPHKPRRQHGCNHIPVTWQQHANTIARLYAMRSKTHRDELHTRPELSVGQCAVMLLYCQLLWVLHTALFNDTQHILRPEPRDVSGVERITPRRCGLRCMQRDRPYRGLQ